jgi:hypothetical protein
MRVLRHSNVRSLHLRLRSLILDSPDVNAIPPRHSAGILNERNNGRLFVGSVCKMYKSTFHNEPAQSSHHQWVISLAIDQAREDKFVGVQFQHQYSSIPIVLAILSETKVTNQQWNRSLGFVGLGMMGVGSLAANADLTPGVVRHVPTGKML